MHNSSLAENDKILFGSRWVLLFFICVALLIFHVQIGSFDTSSLVVAFVFGSVTNIVIWFFLTTPALARGVSLVLLLCDLLMAVVFAATSEGNFLVQVIAGSAIMLSGLLRPRVRWNMAQVTGVFVTMAIVPLLFFRVTVDVALLVLFLVGLLTVFASYAYDLELVSLRRHVDSLSGSQSNHLDDVRTRTRAISELTYTMSATLNYKKVLDTVLEAGRIGLRMPEREQSSLFAGIFLFHVDDNKLHVVSSRRFTRADDLRVISGTEGIVGTALKEAIPVFGTDATQDPELQYFVAFQACKSLLVIPLRAGFDNFGVLLYGSDTANAFTQEHSELLNALGAQATLALQNAVLYHNLLEEKERIVDVDEEARKKLARDLHDGPTQSVAAIAMRMSYISKLYKKSPELVPEEIKKVEDLARRTTSEIRHMLFTLRPLVLETQGLSAALNQLAAKTYEMHKQAVAIQVERSVEERLDFQQQGVIFNIAEEAVNNARKHAKAKVVSVTVTRQDVMAIVQVADNGIGFDVDKMNDNYESRSSLGMINMRERAGLLDGTLSVESTRGRGTVVTLILPLKTPETATASNGFSRPRTKLALAAAARLERAENRHPYL
jgi:signal transduction histidine kinase